MSSSSQDIIRDSAFKVDTLVKHLRFMLSEQEGTEECGNAEIIVDLLLSAIEQENSKILLSHSPSF